jgi:5'-deoxynucleotidase YfbR-like HD superfamily hydrolase
MAWEEPHLNGRANVRMASGSGFGQLSSCDEERQRNETTEAVVDENIRAPAGTQSLDTTAFALPDMNDLPTTGKEGDAPTLSADDVRTDIAAIIWSMRLHGIRRYFRQRHWEQETSDAEYASRIEPSPRLESVSEHSWHIADTLLVIAPHFKDVDRARCVEMAILHDKLELLTGDLSPIGRDGTGLKSHAFDPSARTQKDEKEIDALQRYLQKLRPALREHQRALFNEMQDARTHEAGLLKAVDKLQTLAFVHSKKNGQLTDAHLQFTIRYASRCLAYFPRIQQHYSTLLRVFLTRVAQSRSVPVRAIYRDFVHENQLSLFS